MEIEFESNSVTSRTNEKLFVIWFQSITVVWLEDFKCTCYCLDKNESLSSTVLSHGIPWVHSTYPRNECINTYKIVLNERLSTRLQLYILLHLEY